MAKKKIKRNNKYFIGGLVNSFGDWNKSSTDNFMGSSLGKGLGKLGVTKGGLGGIANTAATAIGGLLAGGKESGVGNALQGIGSLASNIPGVGGAVGAFVNLGGGIINAVAGSKLNKEEIAKVEGQIGNLNSFTSNASDYDALASNYTNMPAMGYFSKDDIGSDGWFSNKAKNKWEELKKEKEQAEQWVQNSLFNNAQNIATNKQQLLEANYAAYGGPINMKYTGVMSPFGNQFGDGGSKKRKYIGGSKDEVRRKYFNYDTELSQVLSNLASNYGISPELVFDRLGHEGLIDRLVRDNNEWVLSGGDPNYPADAFDMDDYNDPFGLLGLDNIFDTYTKGITKTKRPINFIRQVNLNEKNEKVNSGETKNLYDTLELFVAELASRRNQVKKQYPNLTDKELDSATAARYNASNKYFKQLMDSGEYKTKYPINVKGINIPTPTKTDSKYIQEQEQNVNVGDILNELTNHYYGYSYTADGNTFTFGNKSWNPKLFVNEYDEIGLEHPMVDNFINNYINDNYTVPSKVKVNNDYYEDADTVEINKKAEGGPLDTRMELLRRLKEKRNRRGTYGGGKHGGAGASSLFLESPDDFTLVKDTIWVPYRETFNDAFGRARAAGLDEFMFDNKAYTTELGDNPDNNRAGEERVIEGLLPVERTKKVKNKKAEGGELFTNGVTFINNGDTHENNPLEGVRIGVDENFVPNLVEEGEVIFDDYVFSNRLRVPKAVRQKYKLRGVTFADAAKDVQKESEERPNDPISKNGLEAFMQILMSEQEMVRAKKESNKYAKGGRLCNKFYDAGPIDKIDFPYSVYSSRPEDSFDFSKWFTVDKNNLGKVTDYTDAYRNYKFTADKAREWAKLFGNDESLKSYLSKGNKLEDLTDEDVQKNSLDNKHGWLHKARAMMANLDNANTIDVDNIFKELNSTPFKPLPIKSVPIEIEDDIEELPEEKVKEIAPMQDNWLRKLPVWMSGVAVANDLFGGNEPDYSNADLFARAIRGTNRQIGYRPIGNYLKYTPFDTDYYINKLDADTAAERRAVINTSGGNRAAALAGILSTDYNYGNQLGDLARKAEEYNLDQRQKVEDFNRNTNIFNSEAGTKVDMFNAEQDMQRARMYGSLAEYRDKILAANRAEKSANLTNFIQGLGDLGREKADRDMLRWLTEKGVLKSANGGKINRRKKRGGFTI